MNCPECGKKGANPWPRCANCGDRRHGICLADVLAWTEDPEEWLKGKPGAGPPAPLLLCRPCLAEKTLSLPLVQVVREIGSVRAVDQDQIDRTLARITEVRIRGVLAWPR